MENQKTSVFSNGLIWFGAAVSIAEILTGTLIAPLGFVKGLGAILLGHAIGCILMYFAGLIGARTEKSAMDTVKISFGSKGALLFSVLNILQLVGWTAVMIIGGARATG
ncbi:MAG TPA: putative hydroxymethylpyrimidine transporter CytX, partial [Ruminiclostridium sp.]|nr:putative hydroxymethylpyrimidine transporter CytX [Ruminiclostridium sp.]